MEQHAPEEGYTGQSSPPRIIVDTDAGIDDAIAILMLLEAHKQGRINLVAITTTFGNTTLANVNKNVLRLLDTVGMLHIPVYSGAQSPLVLPHHPLGSAPFSGLDGFGNSNLPHPDVAKHIQKIPAAVKIVEEVQKGGLTLLAIGPLTNVALAKHLEPRLLSLLTGLHIMGGNITAEGNDLSPCAEFNFASDPEAAQIVLSHNIVFETPTDVQQSCVVQISPWETCVHAGFDQAFKDQLHGAPTPQALLLTKGDPLRHSRGAAWLACDGLAAAWMLDTLLGNTLLQEADRQSYSPVATDVMECSVTVEIQGRHTRGQMVLDRTSLVSYALPALIVRQANQTMFKRYVAMGYGLQF